MKNKFTIILTLLFLLCLTSKAQWQQTNGPFGGAVNCIISDGTTIYAGTDNGIFTSNNNGSNWAIANNGITNLRILCFAVNGNNIFAGSINGLFLSTNSGASWSNITNGGIPFPEIKSIT